MRLIYFTAVLLFGISALAQDVDRTPVSWAHDLGAPESIDMSLLEMSHVVAEDQLNDQDKNRPWRYGIERPLVLNNFESGTWTDLPDGQRVWRLVISSPNALNISINFSEIYLPDGGHFQVYNTDRSDWSKVHTSSNREILKMGISMEKEYIIGQMEISITVLGKMTKGTERELLFGPQETNI